MALEITFFAFFCYGVYTFLKRIWRFVKREPAPEKVNALKLKESELAFIMIARAERGDKEAENWLLEHGYEKA